MADEPIDNCDGRAADLGFASRSAFYPMGCAVRLGSVTNNVRRRK